MNILFLHPNIPGQYRHIVKHLAQDSQYNLSFLSYDKNITLPGVKRINIEPQSVKLGKVHPYVDPLQTAVVRGQQAHKACQTLKKQGYQPDLICAHPGWGEALFLKDVFPQTPILAYAEFYYQAFGADVHFDPQEPVKANTVAKVRIKNAHLLLSLEACDAAVSPTAWQRSRHPQCLQPKIHQIHEGIDLAQLNPTKLKSLRLPGGLRLNQEDHEVVTYIARNLEPYRGFPSLMKAVQILHKERPKCHVIVIGNDGVSYGAQPPKGETYKSLMLKQVNIDPKRIHFLGSVSHEDLHKALRIGKAHIYLTVPFVLSWSLLEAMGLGCTIIGSDTAPVQEVITNNQEGLLADFFSPEDIAQKVIDVLNHPDQYDHLGVNARRKVHEHYNLETLLPKHIDLMLNTAQMSPRTLQQTS